MEEPFADTLYLALRDRGCHVRPMQRDEDNEAGMFTVTSSNDKVYTVTFRLAE